LARKQEGGSVNEGLSRLRIGYVPYSNSFEMPGDRRRFVHYARSRKLNFEIADPGRSYDVVVLSERADVSVWSRYRTGKLVYDLIDSYLAIPRSDFKGRMRGLAKFISRQSRYPTLDYWRALEAMCKRADAVVCTTEEQKRDISEFCSNVHLILDAHTSVARAVKQSYAASQPFRLVWEGLPYTMSSLELIRPVLQRLRHELAIELHLVTDLEYYRYLGRFGRRKTVDTVRRLFTDVRLHAWREDDCADIICSCDLAVIPSALADPFSAGKPENKLLLLWRMGMPVVASATPACVRAMTCAGLAMVCDDEDDWYDTLRKYVTDETARYDAGQRGLAYARTHHSEEETLHRWDSLFRSLF
jgi:glycosyltransferase involved in cell wall biosynthesis